MTKEEFKSYFDQQFKVEADYFTYIIVKEDQGTFSPIIEERIEFEDHVNSLNVDDLIYLQTKANIPAFRYER